MSTKTISLKAEAYQRLRSARRYPGESFSEIVLRAAWPEDTICARDLIGLMRRSEGFTDDELAQVDEMKSQAIPPEDKWTVR